MAKRKKLKATHVILTTAAPIDDWRTDTITGMYFCDYRTYDKARKNNNNWQGDVGPSILKILTELVEIVRARGE